MRRRRGSRGGGLNVWSKVRADTTLAIRAFNVSTRNLVITDSETHRLNISQKYSTPEGSSSVKGRRPAFLSVLKEVILWQQRTGLLSEMSVDDTGFQLEDNSRHSGKSPNLDVDTLRLIKNKTGTAQFLEQATI